MFAASNTKSNNSRITSNNNAGTWILVISQIQILGKEQKREIFIILPTIFTTSSIPLTKLSFSYFFSKIVS